MMDKPQGFLDLEFRIRRALLVLVYLAIGGLLALMLYYARPAIEFALTVLSPFIVALIVAYIFNPIVNWLQRRFKLGRIWGVVITYGLILGITAGFFAILLPILYGQLRTGIIALVNNFPTIMDKATTWLRLRVSPAEMEQARDFIRNNIDLGAVTGGAGDAMGQAFDTTKLLTRAIGTTLSVIVGFFAFVTFVVVICFYFLLDYNRMEHIARVLLPEDEESRVFTIWARIDGALGGFLRGQLIVATTVGVLYTIALMLMGMKEYAVLIGFLAGFGNMIPYLGPVIGGVPTALWILFGNTYSTGDEKMFGIGIVILFSIAVQSLDGFFLQPRIVGKNAELHPLLVLLALLIGAQFGLGGMIIAVPAAIMARMILKELWWDPLERQELENKRLAMAGPMQSSSDFKKSALVGPKQTAASIVLPDFVEAKNETAVSSANVSPSANEPIEGIAPKPPSRRSRNRRRR